MRVPRVSGSFFDGKRFRAGTVEWEDDVITSVRSSVDRSPLAKGLIIPGLWNAHTHLGDAVVTRELTGTIEQLVAPPHGLKHRILARAKDDAVVTAMRRAMSSMVRSGTAGYSDFREGGLKGLKLLYGANAAVPIRGIALGRPAGLAYDPREVAGLLRACDGIGVSALRDWPPGELEKVAADCRRARKPFGIHCSERVRERLDPVLGLRPAFLVHMVQATDADLARCADAGVPIVVCPRSNAFFGLTPDLLRMVRAGVELWLGTDNAMLNAPSMLREMEATYRIARARGGPSARDILEMALRGRKLLDREAECGLSVGDPADLVVLDLPGGPHGFASLMRAVASDLILTVIGGRPWHGAPPLRRPRVRRRSRRPAI
jgi:cytosine/adenosine deaminase-related metal-dependent hydrolase